MTRAIETCAANMAPGMARPRREASYCDCPGEVTSPGHFYAHF